MVWKPGKIWQDTLAKFLKWASKEAFILKSWKKINLSYRKDQILNKLFLNSKFLFNHI